jgi:hypothetical protein
MWRKLHNEKLYDSHASPNIIRVIKLGSTRYARHMTNTNEKRFVFKVLMGKEEA